MLPRAVLYDGSEGAPAKRMALRAGPLSMVFEPEQGVLRYIRMGDREILRGIYMAVRDRNWGTIAPRVSNLKAEGKEGGFRLTFDVACREREVDFFWKGVITGGADGTVAFAMDGEARSRFLRNRIGFCVLHPGRGCAGKSCRVEKDDGTVDAGAFPDAISPHQPFLDMRAISHEVAPGVWAEVRFEGDTFEMEDQRNWTDASYKTYCTPLRLPFPVEVRKGQAVSQSVTVKLKGQISSADAVAPEGADEILISVADTTSMPLPAIGLGMAGHGEALTEREVARLRALHLAHLRADLKLYKPGWEDALRQAAAEAGAIEAPLEVALFLSDAAEDELEALCAEAERIRPGVVRWLIFHIAEKSTVARWIGLARRFLKASAPESAIGSGTNAYFTELNRERPPLEHLDLVCYSLNPQVHAFDNMSLVEALEAQAWTVESARRFVGNLPIAVTPVTLRPRFNPNATGPEPEPGPGELPAQVDVRQMSLFGAGWTLGSLKHLSQSGVQSVTCYETTGWQGVMEREAGPPAPERFHSIHGGAFPLYHVLADFGEFAGGHVVPSVSSAPLRAEGMALRKGALARILVANLSPGLQNVRLVWPGLTGTVCVKPLDETNAEEAMRSPEAFRKEPGERMQVADGALRLALRPYAVVRVDASF